MKIKFGGLIFDDFEEYSDEERVLRPGGADFRGEWGWSQVCAKHGKMLEDNGMTGALDFANEEDWDEDECVDEDDCDMIMCGVEGCTNKEQIYVDMRIKEVEEIAE